MRISQKADSKMRLLAMIGFAVLFVGFDSQAANQAVKKTTAITKYSKKTKVAVRRGGSQNSRYTALEEAARQIEARNELRESHDRAEIVEDPIVRRLPASSTQAPTRTSLEF